MQNYYSTKYLITWQCDWLAYPSRYNLNIIWSIQCFLEDYLNREISDRAVSVDAIGVAVAVAITIEMLDRPRGKVGGTVSRGEWGREGAPASVLTTQSVRSDPVDTCRRARAACHTVTRALHHYTHTTQRARPQRAQGWRLMMLRVAVCGREAIGVF